MKILDNGNVRDATPEEISAFEDWQKTTSPDAEAALTRYANELTGASDTDLISAAETLIEQRIKED